MYVCVCMCVCARASVFVCMCVCVCVCVCVCLCMCVYRECSLDYSSQWNVMPGLWGTNIHEIFQECDVRAFVCVCVCVCLCLGENTQLGTAVPSILTFLHMSLGGQAGRFSE